jgi:hypothetical protein
VYAEQKPNIERKGLAAKFTADTAGSFLVRADSGKIKQVVNNLIDNAVKYTPKGSIGIALEHRPDDRTIRLSVTDTGVGIPPGVLPYLFTKFGRAKNASRVNISGTGLGLYLVKEIMKAHRGHAWAESDGEGKGASFHIEFYTNIIVGS